jgi:hypothetical protein
MQGDANGAPTLAPVSMLQNTRAKYPYRLINGGIDHNLPQEAPEAFAKAVMDVDRF